MSIVNKEALDILLARFGDGGRHDMLLEEFLQELDAFVGLADLCAYFGLTEYRDDEEKAPAE
jgi:hypothetical protein